MAKQPFQRKLWKTREEALTALEGPLRQEAAILQDAFAPMDACIAQLLTRDTKYTRVWAIGPFWHTLFWYGYIRNV